MNTGKHLTVLPSVAAVTLMHLSGFRVSFFALAHCSLGSKQPLSPWEIPRVSFITWHSLWHANNHLSIVISASFFKQQEKKNLICIKVSSNGDSTLTRLSILMTNENFIEDLFYPDYWAGHFQHIFFLLIILTVRIINEKSIIFILK